MRIKTGRGVGGAHRIPPAALSGSGIVQRCAEASTRLGERATAVDERRDGSSLSPCSIPSVKTYFAAIDANRRHGLGVVRALTLVIAGEPARNCTRNPGGKAV